MGYIGTLVQHSLGVNGSRLNAQGCLLPLARLLEGRFQEVLTKLRAAHAQLSSNGKAVRQVLRDNFLDSSQRIRLQVLALVEEAIRQAERVLAGEIIIECSTVPDCCSGGHPACIIPERGLDRIIICVQNLRLQQGGSTRQEQILLHELFHRAGLRGPEMHAIQFADIDCAQRDSENKNIREQAKRAVNLLEIVDLHVRTVWCLATIGMRRPG